MAFLGGTIGNLEPAARAVFLDQLAGIEEPEQKWPATKTMPLETKTLATATACLGSHWSSSISSLIPTLPFNGVYFTALSTRAMKSRRIESSSPETKID